MPPGAVGEYGIDEHQVAAEALDAARDALLRSGARRGERDDRGDADDDAEHGQQRAQKVAAQRDERRDEDVDETHARASLDGGGPAVGCAVASGACGAVWA